MTEKDWRETVISRIEELMKEAYPEITLERKYKKPSNPEGDRVWYCDGMITTGEIYKEHLRFTFKRGPELKEFDPKGLINTYRAIIIKKEDKLDEEAFKELIRNAVRLNHQAKAAKK